MSVPDADPALFAWDVATGAGGVTADRAHAVDQVNKELLKAPPGTCAIVRRVQMPVGDGLYRDAGTVATARRDPVTGAVVWT